MFVVEWIPGPTAIPRAPQKNPSAVLQSTDPIAVHPTMWRAHFPEDVVANMIPFYSPRVSVTNSDLDLEGGILHNNCVL